MQSPDPGFAVAEREIERAQEARSLGAELWSGTVPPDAEELRWLIADGLEKGFLSYDEIGRASCRKECSLLCRSRWSPYH